MSEDHQRDPCPWVILNDFGGAFAMGAVGGTIWHGIKGSRNSPRGFKLNGSLAAITARAPLTGGQFGMFGGVYSAADCTVKGYRQKEDIWNPVIAGGLTGAALWVRAGPKVMLGQAAFCAILLGVIEGVGAFAGKFMGMGNKPVAPIIPDTQINPATP